MYLKKFLWLYHVTEQILEKGSKSRKSIILLTLSSHSKSWRKDLQSNVTIFFFFFWMIYDWYNHTSYFKLRSWVNIYKRLPYHFDQNVISQLLGKYMLVISLRALRSLSLHRNMFCSEHGLDLLALPSTSNILKIILLVY